ncbi:hypothetical protein GH714_028873 [Hevea brasiliensis]|uniref:Uncharacterized protein n=1 Tax=Hevea brasiliensis TaxID=3981 RepID=A0A6A6KB25_HEVBR|nr:hypothetical protein GH714_028873 [Hevea brasiliensis]
MRFSPISNRIRGTIGIPTSVLHLRAKIKKGSSPKHDKQAFHKLSPGRVTIPRPSDIILSLLINQSTHYNHTQRQNHSKRNPSLLSAAHSRIFLSLITACFYIVAMIYITRFHRSRRRNSRVVRRVSGSGREAPGPSRSEGGGAGGETTGESTGATNGDPASGEGEGEGEGTERNGESAGSSGDGLGDDSDSDGVAESATCRESKARRAQAKNLVAMEENVFEKKRRRKKTVFVRLEI